MRVILVLVLVLWGVYLWRKRGRTLLAKFKAFVDSSESENTPPTVAPPSIGAPQDMVACKHCLVHVPVSEAVAGLKGIYCCASHRMLAES
jgi:uncharacterized protein